MDILAALPLPLRRPSPPAARHTNQYGMCRRGLHRTSSRPTIRTARQGTTGPTTDNQLRTSRGHPTDRLLARLSRAHLDLVAKTIIDI